MIEKNAAQRIAEAYLSELSTDIEFIIIDEFTISRDYGWIFFYNSKRFLETGNISDALAGNGPIVVEKSDGSLHQLGTALGGDEEIRRYELSRPGSQ